MYRELPSNIKAHIEKETNTEREGERGLGARLYSIKLTLQYILLRL